MIAARYRATVRAQSAHHRMFGLDPASFGAQTLALACTFFSNFILKSFLDLANAI